MRTFANLSGGRDSTAMVIKWLEDGNKLDYALFCDTGYEFRVMYEYIDKIGAYLKSEFGLPLTILNMKETFDYWAFEYPIVRGEKVGMKRGLPKKVGRDFCTRETKSRPTREFVKKFGVNNKFQNQVLIGYTYNEVEKGRTSTIDYAVARYPLHEWGWNEKEVSDFLAKRGIMNPLYNHFKRTGCFFCPHQSIQSWQSLFLYYPVEWELSKRLEAKATKLGCANQTFNIGKTLESMEEYLSSKESNLEEFYTDSETCFCHK